MLKLFFVSFLIFASTICLAQNEKKDSILNLLEYVDDQNSIPLLYSELARIYEKENLDSAIYYSQRGYELSKKSQNYLGLAENARNLGVFNIMNNDLTQAEKYYSLAVEHYSKNDMLFESIQNKMRIGNINLAQNNYITAIKIYQECLFITKENNFSSLLPHLYNNLGLLYLETEDYNGAQTNFELAHRLFLENNDEGSASSSLHNLSLIKANLGEYESAIEGYLSVASYHLKSKNWISLAFSYNSISEIYRFEEDYKKARQYLNMSLNALSGESDSFASGPTSLIEVGVYTNAAELNHEEFHLIEATKFAKKALNIAYENSYQEFIYRNAKILGMIHDNKGLSDSALIYYKIYLDNFDQYRNEADIKKLTKLKMQNEFDEILKAKEIKEIYREASYKQKEFKYLAIIIFTMLFACILFLLYSIQKNKNEKLLLTKENLLLEKKKLNLDLEYKKKELVSNMMYLLEKNEFISSISGKLIKMKPDTKKDNRGLLQQIINEIKHNSTAQIWDDFEVRFKEVHADFYDKLNKSYPDLTLNEIKICAFLRLKMTTKEISAITHQSVKSINMARFRLRKKINIEREDNLSNFLNSL